MRYLAITVDTEADWADQRLNELTNIDQLHYLQDMCGRYDGLPSYLVTYEVANSTRSVDVIRSYLDNGECEVGHHMHIWTTPPFEKPNKCGVDERWFLGIQSEISDEMFAKKMHNLHKAIQENFNVRPESHRAGRWSVDRRTLQWLKDNDYVVDTSVRSKVFWERTKGVEKYIEMNTLEAPSQPYFPHASNFAMARCWHRGTRKLPSPICSSLRHRVASSCTVTKRTIAGRWTPYHRFASRSNQPGPPRNCRRDFHLT